MGSVRGFARNAWHVGAIGLGVMLLVGMGAPSALATEPPRPAPIPGAPSGSSSSGRMLELNSASDPDAARAAAACVPVALADTPHISSDGSGEISSHGSWKLGSCRDSKATVAIQLQEFFSDGIWRTRGTYGTGTYAPGGGAGKRATSRAVCVSPVPAAWRAWVVVQTPSGGRASGYANTVNVPCRDQA